MSARGVQKRGVLVAIVLGALAVVAGCSSAPPPPAPKPAQHAEARPAPPRAVSAKVLDHLTLSPAGAKRVALTFDDGPGPYTAAILRVLQQNKVPAVFCQIGMQVGQRQAALERRIVAAGYQLCDHTEHHRNVRRMPAAAAAVEVTSAAQAIARFAGVAPRFFRAPSGSFSPAADRVAAEAGMTPLGWTVDPDDWRRPGTSAIVSRVVSKVRPGVIVIMHDAGGNRSQTLRALPTIIKTLRAKGYTFVLPG